MGMFDTVNVRCPRCADLVEFQSKAGNCGLESYDYRSVPPEIAKDLDGSIEVCPCGRTLELVNPAPILSVRMSIK